MKTPEDEAFEEIERKQGGGFPAKRAMAADKLHWSDCAVHNGPAYPAGPCDCGVAQEPVAHSVISGALFDFMGWLTSRKERIVLSSADNASPAVEAITEFARMRNLSLDDAKVQDWRTTSPKRPWVGLTDVEIAVVLTGDASVALNLEDLSPSWIELVQKVEAKLKEKNT